MSGASEKLSQILDLFHTIFVQESEKRNGEEVGIDGVVVLGGFPEPFYQPAKPNVPAEIHFTRDYLNSCFHEIAHWCIAGKLRRRQDDYGYWYLPDGRDGMAQQAFFQAEAGPQALEWVFATASGEAFRISCDNLSGEGKVEDKLKEEIRFTEELHRKLERYLEDGFPPRGKKFLLGLMAHFHPEVEESAIQSWLRVRTLPTSSTQGESFSLRQ